MSVRFQLSTPVLMVIAQSYEIVERNDNKSRRQSTHNGRTCSLALFLAAEGLPPITEWKLLEITEPLVPDFFFFRRPLNYGPSGLRTSGHIRMSNRPTISNEQYWNIYIPLLKHVRYKCIFCYNMHNMRINTWNMLHTPIAIIVTSQHPQYSNNLVRQHGGSPSPAWRRTMLHPSSMGFDNAEVGTDRAWIHYPPLSGAAHMHLELAEGTKLASHTELASDIEVGDSASICGARLFL